MSVDYDTPRRTDNDDATDDSLKTLTTSARRGNGDSDLVDTDEAELDDLYELPGADLSAEELTVRVLPRQRDEFVCASCFLVHHRHQLVTRADGALICRDCA
ncbi:MAG TPA: DUF4193 domain-containing protein [Mycobacterium sp.]|nr:DUF4193 domain-containing protein [Mycobacterium sp.]